MNKLSNVFMYILACRNFYRVVIESTYLSVYNFCQLIKNISSLEISVYTIKYKIRRTNY